MPEAVKEVAPEKTPEKIVAKEVKPAEASSGTLPSDEQKLKDIEECAVAPDIGTDKPEEGKNCPEPDKNGPEPSAQPADDSKGNGVTEKSSPTCTESDKGKTSGTKEEKGSGAVTGGEELVKEDEKTKEDVTSVPAQVDKVERGDEKSSGESAETDNETTTKNESLQMDPTVKDSPDKGDSSNAAVDAHKKNEVGEEKSDQVHDNMDIDDSKIHQDKPPSNADPEKEKDSSSGDNTVPGKESDSTVQEGKNDEKEKNDPEKIETPKDELGQLDKLPAKSEESVSKSPDDSKDVLCEKPVDCDNSTVKTTPMEIAADGAANENTIEAEAGRSTEVDPLQVEEVKRLIREAKEQMALSEFFNAADLFGKACEIAGKIYGELAAENAELYYLYGCAMLECAKNENAVLGEAVKEKENEEDEDSEAAEDKEGNGEESKKEGEEDPEKEEPEEENGQVNGDEKMEVEEGNKEDVDGNNDEEKESTENGVESEATGEEGKEKDEEDEDSSLKTAWEMFELAKVIYSKTENKMKLSETYIKLGEVGMESGHEDSIEDMKKALELRLNCAAENDRLIAETHFNIGLAYATFQKFDDAINSFKQSKSMIEGKIEKLKLSELTEEKESEIKELTELLPDLDEKIQDMKDSREAKLKAEQDTKNGAGGAGTSEDSKPISNITHLVKRKRKLEDVTSDLLPTTKQACTEEETKPKEATD